MVREIRNMIGGTETGYVVDIEKFFSVESKVVSDVQAVTMNFKKFPAAVLKTFSKNGNVTYLVFRNGSISISGCKSEAHFNKSCDYIEALLKKYKKA